jgi:hypothetical protein
MGSVAADRRRRGAGLLEVLLALLASAMLIAECHTGRIIVVSPYPDVLLPAGPVELLASLPPGAKKRSVEVSVDGVPFEGFSVEDRALRGTLSGLSEGRHTLRIEVKAKGGRKKKQLVVAEHGFEIADLDRPDSCEVLNDAQCALPFPSSHWLAPAATPTGRRVELPGSALPAFTRLDGDSSPLDTARLRENDGFSPTVQVLMNFPGGVDLVQSDASRLLEATRTFDPDRSLAPDHPTVLIDWQTGERVAHFLENDARATDPARVITFLRPAKSLTPGHRYVVAVRNLRDASGGLLQPEPAFAVLRDGRPTTIQGVEARREGMEEIFHRLSELAVGPRRELILAFDFVVQSDASLTAEMLQMRDEALDWIDARIDASEITFTVDSMEEIDPGCDQGASFWRRARGSFEVPLYLTSDPIANAGELGTLRKPLTSNGVYSAPYALAIPCDVFDGADAFDPVPGIVLGHGLFGNGPDLVDQLSGLAGFEGFDYAAAATNWSGLSELEIDPPLFILGIFGDFDAFGALPDRLRQGQLATLVLARMMARGAFNLHPAFQSDEGEGALATDQPPRYFGASLGGIMGLMFAALTPDVPRIAINVGAINFSLLLQRATPFLPFQAFLDSVNPDPLAQALGIQVLHEVWVKGESAGYATHITSDPLPGTQAKQVMMTVGLHDQAVPNLGSQLAGATLGLPVLEGSVLTNLAYVEDAAGPLPSAYIVYDTGAYDPSNPAYEPFLPPLANLQAPDGSCDPHGRMAFIPAALDQLLLFLEEGQVDNFCTDDGLCNASEPYEIPNGAAEPCNPLD